MLVMGNFAFAGIAGKNARTLKNNILRFILPMDYESKYFC
jgi:hypothetical protein